jgi:hypothetical protein
MRNKLTNSLVNIPFISKVCLLNYKALSTPAF